MDAPPAIRPEALPSQGRMPVIAASASRRAAAIADPNTASPSTGRSERAWPPRVRPQHPSRSSRYRRYSSEEFAEDRVNYRVAGFGQLTHDRPPRQLVKWQAIIWTKSSRPFRPASSSSCRCHRSCGRVDIHFRDFATLGRLRADREPAHHDDRRNRRHDIACPEVALDGRLRERLHDHRPEPGGHRHPRRPGNYHRPGHRLPARVHPRRRVVGHRGVGVTARRARRVGRDRVEREEAPRRWVVLAGHTSQLIECVGG